MANVYVYSTAAGGGTGADWANAYTTLAAAFAAKAAGDDFWVAHDHAETQGSAMTLTAPGTSSAPNRVMCVNRAGTVPPVAADLATTATITTTGAFALTIGAGHCYWEGITFSAGSGATNATLTIGSSSAHFHRFKNCGLRKAGTTAVSTAINTLPSQSAGFGVEWVNVTLGFGNVGDTLRAAGNLTWRDTPSAIVATVPTTSLFNSNGAGATVLCENVDFSAITSGVLVAAGSTAPKITIRNCKLGQAAATGRYTVGSNMGTTELYIVRSDNAATNYLHEKHTYSGSLVFEPTIYRIGGASDGTTSTAWKMTSGSTAKAFAPLESFPIRIWNDNITSTVTVTCYGYWDDASLPTNAQIWMEISGPTSATFPIGARTTTGLATVLTAAGNCTADSSTWGGGDATTTFKMVGTIAPLMKGPLTIVVKVAVASTTFYIDPKVVLS